MYWVRESELKTGVLLKIEGLPALVLKSPGVYRGFVEVLMPGGEKRLINTLYIKRELLLADIK
tara:strand:- start:167 stop:355 length:189 start_codon:yes stop_codon:yes gene_type:complete